MIYVKSLMSPYLSLGIPRGLFQHDFFKSSELQEYFFAFSIIASESSNSV